MQTNPTHVLTFRGLCVCVLITAVSPAKNGKTDQRAVSEKGGHTRRPKERCISCGRTLASPGQYDWSIYEAACRYRYSSNLLSLTLHLNLKSVNISFAESKREKLTWIPWSLRWWSSFHLNWLVIFMQCMYVYLYFRHKPIVTAHRHTHKTQKGKERNNTDNQQ